jgi:gluconolactonase
MKKRLFTSIALCLTALLSATVIATLLGHRAVQAAQAKQPPSIVDVPISIDRLDPAAEAIVPAHPHLQRIATGFTWTEGPLWLPSNQLIFAEIPSNSIRIWNPATSSVSVFHQPSGYQGTEAYNGHEPGSNAMALDPAGRLTVAGHARRDVYRFETPDPHGPITVLADTYQGKRLNSPNDLVYRSDGSIYFTDPPYGLRKQNDSDPAKELPYSGIFRIPSASAQKPGTPPNREHLQLLVKDIPRPNGLAFSPDEKYLYVDNSEPHMFWMRYTVHPDGSLSDPKLFAEAGTYSQHGAPDGMKVDRLGNLYSAGPGGVWIFSPEGKHLATIAVPEVVGNLAWGDSDHKTLYITASLEPKPAERSSPAPGAQSPQVWLHQAPVG